MIFVGIGLEALEEIHDEICENVGGGSSMWKWR